MVTSELVLLGYPPRDLIFRQGVVEACQDALHHIAEQCDDLTVIVGHPRREARGCRPLRNSVSVCRRGAVIATYDKRLLPGYDVFDEDRYFEPGDEPVVVEVDGVKLGLTVCEDLWGARDVITERRYAIDPVHETVHCGCDLLLSLNASPFVRGKWEHHRELLQAVARRYRLPLVAVNQIGGNDDVVFDGRSLAIASDGRVAHRLPGWEEAVEVVDLDHLRHAVNGKDTARPCVDPLEETLHALTLGVRDYCRKTGSDRVLLGLSGGIDSALAATIAAAALGPKNVHGVIMPSRFSSPGSRDDALELAKRLGLEPCTEVSIEQAHEMMRASLAPALDDAPEGLTDENIQARLRGLILMAISNARGGLVLATGNKSELAVGYCTMYGDMCGALAVLGDVTKTRVYELARWINAHHQILGFTSPPIPESSIEKVPSAELRPEQSDQDSLPPYEQLDQIIEAFVEQELPPEQIIEMTGLDGAMVRQWVRAIDRAQYKREQAAVVLKVTGRAFGPGRPMPIAMRSTTLPRSTSEPAPSQSRGI